MKIVREIKTYPAFDKRHADPKQNYGIGGLSMHFVVRDEDNTRAVIFSLDTNWHLPHVQRELDRTRGRNATFAAHRSAEAHIDCHPKPRTVDYHRTWRTPRGYCVDDACTAGWQCKEHDAQLQDWTMPECMWLDNKPCVCDGSYMAADSYFQTLVSQGLDALWAELESYLLDIGDPPTES